MYALRHAGGGLFKERLYVVAFTCGPRRFTCGRLVVAPTGLRRQHGAQVKAPPVYADHHVEARPAGQGTARRRHQHSEEPATGEGAARLRHHTSTTGPQVKAPRAYVTEVLPICATNASKPSARHVAQT